MSRAGGSRLGASGALPAVVGIVVLLGACSTASSISSAPEARSSSAAPVVRSSVAPTLSPAVTPSPPGLPSPNASYDPGSDSTVSVVARVEPAVVNVTTRIQAVTSFFGSGTGKAVGTGFIIRSDGVIVTNYHVVEDALNIRVTLPDGRSFTARVIGGNSDHDLAILKVEGLGLPVVPLGDSSVLKLGEPVIALGYALALPGGPSVTQGIISSLARTIRAEDPNGGPNGQGIVRTYQDALQTDAAINPGNSGGPLIDLNGNVVGINTAGDNQAQNIGFSIAISAAMADIQAALDNPAAATPYLGVLTQTNSASLASEFGLAVTTGVIVVQVSPGGAAERAGVEAGDVIVAFDGVSVNTSDGLGRLIDGHRPGDQVAVTVVRSGGDRRTLTVTLAVRPVP